MRSLAWEKAPDNDGINSLSSTIIDISGRNLRLKEQKKKKNRSKKFVHTG